MSDTAEGQGPYRRWSIRPWALSSGQCGRRAARRDSVRLTDGAVLLGELPCFQRGGSRFDGSSAGETGEILGHGGGDLALASGIL